jgi:hypothetical protein
MGDSRGKRASTVVLALVMGGALALPWEGTTGTVYVVDGPAFSRTSTGLDTGFTLLFPASVIAVLLAAAAAVVVASVSARAVRWVGTVSGMVASVVAIAALADHGPAVGSVVGLVAALALLVRSLLDFRDRRAFAALALLVVPLLPMRPDNADHAGGPAELVSGADFDGAARLVPLAGSVGVVDDGEVVVGEDGGFTQVARVTGADVTVLGIVRDRFVYYRADAFEVRVVPLHGGPPAVVTGVVDVDSMTTSGAVLFRTAGVTTPTLRRLDITRVEGTTHGDELDAAPVPATRPLLETDDPARPMRFVEHPGTGQIVTLDNTEMRHPNLVAATPDEPRWRPLVGESYHDGCTTPGDTHVIHQKGMVAADAGDGWWLTKPDEGLVHVRADGYVRVLRWNGRFTLPADMLTGADGRLYLLEADGLRRIPDAESMLPRPAPEKGVMLPPNAKCPPLPVVADPVRLDPIELGYNPGLVPDGSGGVWERLWDHGAGVTGDEVQHRGADGQVLASYQMPTDEPQLWPDLTGGMPFAGRCPPTRTVGGVTATPAPIEGCWDALVIGRDGRGWGVVAGRLYSFGPAGVVALTHGDGNGSPASSLALGNPPDTLALPSPSMALDASGTPLVLVDDVLLGATEQGVVVLGQDTRLRGGTLFTSEDGAVVRTRDDRAHRLGY